MPGPQVIPRPPGWRRGGPSPWSHLSPGERKGIGLDRVLAAIHAGVAPDPEAHPLELDLSKLRSAAVLVALFEEDGEAHLVLTRRAATLRSHTHQVSFPGGRVDEGETAVEAALREADEEVGLDPSSVAVVGRLPPLATFAGGNAMEPIVGVLAERPLLVANPAEVERAFSVSIAELVADGCHHEERWDLPNLPDRAIHFFDLPEDLVWGATARVLFGLLTAVLGAGAT